MTPHALCLVGGALSEPKIESLRSNLSARGIVWGGRQWLKPGYALDLYLEVPAQVSVAQVVRDVRRALPQIDAALVPLEDRRKSLLIADMDSTLITSESIVEIARVAGVEQAVESLTNQAMRGRVDFVEALMDRVSLVKGTALSHVVALGQSAVLSPGAATLCATMAEAGARLVMVSGGFTHIASGVAQRLGLHRYVANQFVVADGKLTGGLNLPLVDAAMKAQVLLEECASGNLSPSQVLGVGDGANDLDMIQLAGLGVAYQGKPVLQDAADAAIVHTDLISLLYFQGYEEAEIIAA